MSTQTGASIVVGRDCSPDMSRPSSPFDKTIPLVYVGAPSLFSRGNVRGARGGARDQHNQRTLNMTDQDPRISIVIPIYNEQGILHSAVVDLRERLKPFGWSYEIILAENGSKDRTVEIGHELAREVRRPEGRAGQDHQHGRAELRQGAQAGHPPRPRRARHLRRDRPLRRRVPPPRHRHPRQRRGRPGHRLEARRRRRRTTAPCCATPRASRTRGCSAVILGFRGTDTHGLKAFRRVALLDTVRACLVDKDVFASEFVIRADRGGVKVEGDPGAHRWRSARRRSTSSSASRTS